MTRRRQPPPTYIRSRGVSVPPSLSRWSSYSSRSVRASSPVDDLWYLDLYKPKTHYYDTSREEGDIRRSVNRHLMFSSSAMDDTSEIAKRSRNRDKDLLREANNALPPSINAISDDVSSASSPRRFQSSSVVHRSEAYFTPGSSFSRDSSVDRDRVSKTYELIKKRYAAKESPITSPSLSPYQSPRASPDRELITSRWSNRYSSARSRKTYTNPYDDTDSLATTDWDDTYDEYEKYLNYPISSDGYNDLADESYSASYSSSIRPKTYRSTAYVPLQRREISPAPLECMAYTPKKMTNYTEDTHNFRSSVSELPSYSVVPYRASSYGSSVDSDVRFHNMVAAAAAKAREAIRNVDLDEYETASLVLSVEGETRDPIQGRPLGFQYVARPIPLKGPNLQGPALFAARSTDSDFNRYLKDLDEFRNNIRQRIISGYSILNESLKIPRYSSSYGGYTGHSGHTGYTGSRYLTSSSDYDSDSGSAISSYSSPYSYLLSRYRKRLEDDDYSYGDSLRLYPISGSTRASLPPSSDALASRSDVMDVFGSRSHDNELSTLEKIKIKVNTELAWAPRSVYNRRYRATSVPPMTSSSVKVSSVYTPPPSTAPLRRYWNEVDYWSPYRHMYFWDDDLYRKTAIADWYTPRSKEWHYPYYYSRTHEYSPRRYDYYPYYSDYYTPRSANYYYSRSADGYYPSYSDWYSPSYRYYPKSYPQLYSSRDYWYSPRSWQSYYPRSLVYDDVGRWMPQTLRYETVAGPRLKSYSVQRTSRARSEPRIVVEPPRYRMAAIVGRKVDVVTPRKKPHSEYTVKALRRMHLEKRDQTSPVEEVAEGGTKTVSIDTVDEYAPKSILSWQHRIQSRVPAEDLIAYNPKQFSNLRMRVSDVKDKMDRHRQLMDRYLDTDTITPIRDDVRSRIYSKYVDLEERNPNLFRRRGGENTSSVTETTETVTSSTSASVRASSVYRNVPRFRAESEPIHEASRRRMEEPDNYHPMSDVRLRVRRVIRKNMKTPHKLSS